MFHFNPIFCKLQVSAQTPACNRQFTLVFSLERVLSPYLREKTRVNCLSQASLAGAFTVDSKLFLWHSFFMKIHINDILLYYKKVGQGPPIVLLHGNGQDHTIFRLLIKKISRHYTVYALDSRDHGKSSRVKTLHYMTKMDDVADFIKKLEIEKPVLYGFSDGGIIGLLLAIHHPDMLEKLIISGANTNPGGIKRFPFFLIKVGYFFTRSKKLKLMLTEPDITDAELSSIITPALVLAGRRDIIKQEHTVALAESIPVCGLEILKGHSHASYVVNSEKIYEIIMEFLGDEHPQD